METITTMSRKTLVMLTAVLLCGCTVTEFSPDTRAFKRTSFLQRAEFGKLIVKPDGSVTLEGYKNDGGAATMEAVARGAAQGAVAGASPVP